MRGRTGSTWQAYRAFGVDLSSGYVASYYRDMQHYFGASGQVSIGNVACRPTTTCARWSTTCGCSPAWAPGLDLEDAVRSYGADGVAAILRAGHDPMQGPELAGATRMSPAGAGARGAFAALDATATALTPVVTTLSGHPRGPNTYPAGCAGQEGPARS